MERRYEPILTAIKSIEIKRCSRVGTSGISGETYPMVKCRGVRNSFTPATRDLDVFTHSGEEELASVTADLAFKIKRCRLPKRHSRRKGRVRNILNKILDAFAIYVAEKHLLFSSSLFVCQPLPLSLRMKQLENS
jgi:hypothetical protein